MKRTQLTRLLNTKRFRYGGYATLLAVVVIVLIIGLNLMVDLLSWGVDLTKSRLFSLSPQTLGVLDGLTQDVRIYSLSSPGKENIYIDSMLASYRSSSRRIIIQNVDPELHPEFVQQYTTEGVAPNLGDLIVVGKDKRKIIDSEDLVVFSSENLAEAEVTSFAAEQQITGAIANVTEVTPIVAELRGHQEALLPRIVEKSIESENYALRPLALAGGEIPRDAKAVIIATPQTDISEEEAQKLLAYVGNGGGLLVLLDLADQELPRLKELIGAFAIDSPRAFVVEADRSYHTGNPVQLLPAIRRHAIVEPLIEQKAQVFLPYSRPLVILENRGGLTVEPLLLTSKGAWGKTDLADTTVDQKKTGDVDGPFSLAVAVSGKLPGAKAVGRIVVVGSGNFLEDAVARNAPGNVLFVTSSLNWLSDRGAGIGIAPKSLEPPRLQISSRQAYILSGVAAGVIPGICLGLGLLVWLRRRYR